MTPSPSLTGRDDEDRSLRELVDGAASDGFGVGAEVFRIRYSYGGAPSQYERVKIEKVYKNGNVVVGGQQYRGAGDRRHSTAYGYNSPMLALITPATLAQAEASDRSRATEAVIRRFERMSPNKLSHEGAMRIAAILDEEQAALSQASGGER